MYSLDCGSSATPNKGRRLHQAVHARPGFVFTTLSCSGTVEPGSAGNGGKCPQEAMEEISSLEVGSLSNAVVVTVREGGDAHILKLLLQKDKERKANLEYKNFINK